MLFLYQLKYILITASSLSMKNNSLNHNSHFTKLGLYFLRGNDFVPIFPGIVLTVFPVGLIHKLLRLHFNQFFFQHFIVQEEIMPVNF